MCYILFAAHLLNSTIVVDDGLQQIEPVLPPDAVAKRKGYLHVCCNSYKTEGTYNRKIRPLIETRVGDVTWSSSRQ